MNSPFLTALDPRAKIKGSRDPLGFQSIWSWYGRQVVSNLTTVTTRLREFTIFMLGLYFAHESNQSSNKSKNYSGLFIKFEQLAAYSRLAWPDHWHGSPNEIRGVLRATARWNEGRHPVRISSDERDQILSDQRTYGIWGLYTIAARHSGISQPDSPRLTPAAREMVESVYLPRLDRHGDSIARWFEKDREFDPCGQDRSVAEKLAGVLGKCRKEEIDFYTTHLLYACDPGSMQARLWTYMRTVSQVTSFSGEFSVSELRELIRCCSQQDPPLAHALERIRQIESLIAPAQCLFGYVLTQGGQPVTRIARAVTEQWGTSVPIDPGSVRNALAANGDLKTSTRDRLGLLADELQRGEYVAVIELLLEQNAEIMQDRGGGSAWVAKNGHGCIEVRLNSESDDLVTGKELTNLWRNNYFLQSLKSIGTQIEGKLQ